MKKFLSPLLALLLLFTLTLPALAEEWEDNSDAKTSESVSEDTPSEPETGPDPGPAPEPDPGPDPEPLPAPEPVPDPGPDSAPALPEVPAESNEVPPVGLDSPGLPSVPGGLDAPAYDVTELPSGDIIIEEHSYTRTVDVFGSPAAFSLDSLPTTRSALVAVFGEYQPKTQAVSTYYDGQLLDSSTEYVPGVAGMDMEWIAGVVIFAVLLYCLMKFLGGVFK